MTRAYRSPGVACKWRPRDFTVSLLALDRRSKQGQPNAPRHPRLLQGHGTISWRRSGQQEMKHPQGDESFAIDGAARGKREVSGTSCGERFVSSLASLSSSGEVATSLRSEVCLSSSGSLAKSTAICLVDHHEAGMSCCVRVGPAVEKAELLASGPIARQQSAWHY